MRKLTAVTVVVGLSSLGHQAIAGQTGPRGHVTVSIPNLQSAEHANELMSKLSKIPSRAAMAKAEHSPGEFAAKASTIVVQCGSANQQLMTQSGIFRSPQLHRKSSQRAYAHPLPPYEAGRVNGEANTGKSS